MQQQELIPHLFRTESGKITAVLCKQFGIGHVEAAEDIVSETFLAAMETWPYKGIPENPSAWLYTVAKNKAKNQFARDKLFTEKISPRIQTIAPVTEEFTIDLSEQNISDSQLQMLFAVCTPVVATEAQVALALRILCGFGIEEIANAFLVNKETINKRLFRAKEKLRQECIPVAMPSPQEIPARLNNVLTILYLLFNEGYYSETNDSVLRKDLCLEAMRLTCLLTAHSPTNLPEVNALLALMCFHASRFDARTNEKGEMILYHQQDEQRWDQALIAEGVYCLHQSARGSVITRYHLEANIAYWHTIKEDTALKWETILQLYNKLLQIEYSPIAALNRTYALAKANGKEEAIKEAEKLQLTTNQYYFALLGELYKGINNDKAGTNFEKALSLAKTNSDKQVIRQQLEQLFMT